MSDAAVDGFLEDASALVHQGRLVEAFALLQRALQLAPDDAAVHFGVGGIHLHSRRYDEAIDSLQRAVVLDPELAIAHYHLGMALQYAGREPAAVAALRRAVALDPTLADGYARIGGLLQDGPRHAEAIDCFRRAAAVAPDTPAGRLHEAKALIAEARHAEAEALLRRIIADDPGFATAQATLGDILSQAGRFDAAIACYHQAIASEPRHVGAYIGLVAARPIGTADARLVADMTSLLEDEALTGQERMALRFCLGKAFEDSKDYASAMRHFDAANRLRQGPDGLDRAGLTGLMDRTIAQCTPAWFARQAADGVDDETPVLIVGMPRSGTTLVEQIVSSHPAVGAGGELTFWAAQGRRWINTGMSAPGPVVTARIAAEYRALLRNRAPAALRVTDKHPINFTWIGLIHAVFPRARIIHCRRHPLDTCISIYCTPLAGGRTMKTGKADLVFYYRQYQRLMEYWRAVLPADRLLEIDYEALVADREAVTRRLIAFCGLEWDAACLDYENNPHAVQTVSMWQVRQPIYLSSVERWRRYEPWLGELRELLPGQA